MSARGPRMVALVDQMNTGTITAETLDELDHKVREDRAAKAALGYHIAEILYPAGRIECRITYRKEPEE